MRIVRYFPRAATGEGGIARSIRSASAAAVRAGADVTVAVDERTLAAAPHATFRWRGVRHRGVAPFRAPVDLDDLLAGADVLVLHSAWSYGNVRAASAARRLGVPYVLEPRGDYLPGILARRAPLKRLWWWSFERATLHGALAVHRFFEGDDEHLAAFGYGGPFVYAPNGVRVPDEVRWDGGSGGYLLWIGRFDPEHKGLANLLRALAMLAPDARPPLRLHGTDWAGGKRRTARLVDELALGEHVTIGPPVHGEEKWSLIARARAFVYPSQWEGFGNSAAEAVAVGVPTLVTRYALARWLEDRRAVLAVDPDPASLAVGLRRLLSADVTPMAARGREAVRRELTWDASARSWLRQVEALLRHRGRGW